MTMRISILGDSISTFAGYNLPGYLVYYDEDYQAQNHLYKAQDTWWGRVIAYLGGTLCVNNAYSGSRVSGLAFPAAVSMERIRSLGNEKGLPEVILIHIGVNDYGYGVPVWPKEKKASEDLPYFGPAYEEMLRRMKTEYPKAIIIGSTLMKARMKEYDDWKFPTHYHGNHLADYNEAIRRGCTMQGCLLADLADTGILYESLDGTHPDDVGHAEIAAAYVKCFEKMQLHVWERQI